MAKIGILVDSTVIIDQNILNKYKDIEIVSLNILNGTTSTKEIDLNDEDVMTQMRNGVHFKTSQPSPSEFLNAYDNLFAKGYEKVFVFVLSEKISGTRQSAFLAKDNHPHSNDIHIFNTMIANYGVSNILNAFIDELDRNSDYESLITYGENLCKNAYLCFSVLELQHLYRGGRLSKIQAALGVLLRIKPIIAIIEGKLDVVQKARSNQAIIDFFLNVIDKFATSFKTVYLRVVNLKCNDSVKIIEEYIQKYKNIIYTQVQKVGPVFTVHLGELGYGITVAGTN